MTIRFKIWVEEEGTTLFGKGLEELLKGIDECRSLFGAARKLKMSYRAAWGKIKIAEKRTGMKLVVTSGRKGMLLTSDARNIINEYAKMENNINQYLEEYGLSIGIASHANMQHPQDKPFLKSA
ncbi:MAG TPA: LysR family transcriptional regulator [Syntrophales bacterium]|nr:LysR family transcriptional regulator [Syntrophales bacterium]